jgi:hypothetical protein
MVRAFVALLLGLAIAVAYAEDRRRFDRDLDVIVPIDPHEHERVYWFAHPERRVVLPGTVTINGAGYVCDVDRRRFRRQDEFIAHLRLVHHVPAEQIADVVVLTGGQVHFRGE